LFPNTPLSRPGVRPGEPRGRRAPRRGGRREARVKALLVAAVLAATPQQDDIPLEGGDFVVARGADATCVIALQGTITRAASFAFETATARADKLGCAN